MQKTVNNFYAEHKIFYLMQKNFYGCIKQIQIYSEHDVQRANFFNVEKQILSF